MMNQLLRRLPDEVLAFIGPRLTTVALTAGRQLHASHQVARQLYFPTSAVVALRHEDEPGQSLVMALVDQAGMVGISALTGADSTSADVLVAGEALRIDSGYVVGEFQRSTAVQQWLLGWIQVVMTQLVRASACQRFHRPEQRLCMRLTQLAHRRDGRDIALTQLQLGELVGVRRERVNEILRDLMASGLIEQRRGQIRLLDPPGVMRLACSCHGIWMQSLDRVPTRRP